MENISHKHLNTANTSTFPGHQSAALTGSIEDQWKNTPHALFQYENLDKLAQENEIVQKQQDDKFFVISHPARVQATLDDSVNLGWKLHISVHPDDLGQAFNLAAPIISKYCGIFKVTNQKVMTNEQFILGKQFTVYLAGPEEWEVAPGNAEKMRKEIDEVFVSNKIRVGNKPNSDAATFSDYVSIRNDRMERQTLGQAFYIDAETAGKNFNPGNYPNPYSNLLRDQARAFDPLEHFQSFEFDSVVDERRFFPTMIAYLHEYTVLGSLDKKARAEFIFQFCLDDGQKLDPQFLKEPYRNNQEYVLAVKFALSIVAVLEVKSEWWQKSDRGYITLSEFSKQYPFDNSFKKLLVLAESCMREEMSEQREPSAISLIEQGRRIAAESIKNLSEEELVSFLLNGHWYQCQAALVGLNKICDENKYMEILRKNDTLPLVQFALAEELRRSDQKMSDEYALKVMLSASSNYFQPNTEVLLKSQNFDELLSLHKGGNYAASVTLAVICMRDLLPGFSDAWKKFDSAPVDHALAKECIESVEVNCNYAEMVKDLKKELNIS